MASTEWAAYRCVAKEHANGRPWLTFELMTGPAPRALDGKILGIELKPGTTLDEAKELALLIDRQMVKLTVTD